MLLSDKVLSISTGDRLTFFCLVDSFEESSMVFVGDVGHMGEVNFKTKFFMAKRQKRRKNASGINTVDTDRQAERKKHACPSFEKNLLGPHFAFIRYLEDV